VGTPRKDKVTVPGIRARKARHTGPDTQPQADPDRIVALTAYDHPTARILDEAGADILLVGDSVGNVVLGLESTLPVTIQVMLHHTAAVVRAHPRALVVADMPFLSYHTGAAEAVRNAGRFIQEAGAEAVKIEGGVRRAAIIRAMVDADIPVMGHIGLTPQSVNALGGYRVQGRDDDAVDLLLADARAVEEAGAFSIVLEAIPAAVGSLITRSIGIPTIGIGAGPDCDGQILVSHDLFGLTAGSPPRFVRRYADLAETMREAVRRYAADVRAGTFPSEVESYATPPELAQRLAQQRGRVPKS